MPHNQDNKNGIKELYQTNYEMLIDLLKDKIDKCNKGTFTYNGKTSVDIRKSEDVMRNMKSEFESTYKKVLKEYESMTDELIAEIEGELIALIGSYTNVPTDTLTVEGFAARLEIALRYILSTKNFSKTVDIEEIMVKINNEYSSKISLVKDNDLEQNYEISWNFSDCYECPEIHKPCKQKCNHYPRLY